MEEWTTEGARNSRAAREAGTIGVPTGESTGELEAQLTDGKPYGEPKQTKNKINNIVVAKNRKARNYKTIIWTNTPPDASKHEWTVDPELPSVIGGTGGLAAIKSDEEESVDQQQRTNTLINFIPKL